MIVVTRILIDMGHPAHVHFWKNFIWEMESFIATGALEDWGHGRTRDVSSKCQRDAVATTGVINEKARKDCDVFYATKRQQRNFL